MDSTQPSRPAHALALFAPLARRYDRAGALMSLGLEAGWRRRLVAAIPAEPGDRVLDVATGTGLVAAGLVRRHGCRVTGVDQSVEMLALAEERIDQRGLEGRYDLVRARAERLPFPDAAFDHLTVTYLLRYVDDPAATLRELARVLRPGGTFASLEFGLPSAGPARWGWWAYTRWALPAIGRTISREWAETGRFLHRSVPDLYRRHPLSEILAMHRAAGLVDLRVDRPGLGSAVIIVARRAGPAPTTA